MRGFFRQFELYYVIGDECDLMRGRTSYQQGEGVSSLPTEKDRALFLTYVRFANDLCEHPRWRRASRPRGPVWYNAASPAIVSGAGRPNTPKRSPSKCSWRN